VEQVVGNDTNDVIIPAAIAASTAIVFVAYIYSAYVVRRGEATPSDLTNLRRFRNLSIFGAVLIVGLILAVPFGHSAAGVVERIEAYAVLLGAVVWQVVRSRHRRQLRGEPTEE